ncbi:hypothetical protein NC651_025163 [Populus alba x Populus x berolinensis]|nr:hypothetical protein NC651_025163 [Populus alba x Populus x berolinensis]
MDYQTYQNYAPFDQIYSCNSSERIGESSSLGCFSFLKN